MNPSSCDPDPCASFDFDHPIDRRAVPGEKWGRYAGRDVLPLWVADMDFAAPPAVREALAGRLAHGVFGYTEPWPSLLEAVVEGIARDHGWRIGPDWLVWLPGVVSGLNLACRLAAHADGRPAGVFTATPVYPPFLGAPLNQGLRLQSHPLRETAPGQWEWDWDGVKAATDADTRLLMLCNPHNPVGRVFDRDELLRLAAMAEEGDWLICSDEIHCGLVLDEDRAHIPIASLDPVIARRTITLMAPSKTWNIPSLYCGFAIVPDPTLRRRLKQLMRGLIPPVNLLGLVAAEAAYRDGGAWRTALLGYLRGNRDRVCEAVRKMPGLRVNRPQATYLSWIDCRASGLADPAGFFEAAGVGLSDGAAFGAPGFVRLNFGCPRDTLDEALARMARALAAA